MFAQLNTSHIDTFLTSLSVSRDIYLQLVRNIAISLDKSLIYQRYPVDIQCLLISPFSSFQISLLINTTFIKI